MRLEGKHYALLAGFLAATGTLFSGLHGWDELKQPAVVGGFLGQIGVLIGALFVGKPGE